MKAKLLQSMKSAEWVPVRDVRPGDTLAESGLVFRVKRVYRDNDEVVVMGGPQTVRRYSSEEEVNKVAAAPLAAGKPAKTAAIGLGTQIFYHGTATDFDRLEPNQDGIIWLGDKRTARKYAEQDAQHHEFCGRKAHIRLLKVRLKPGALLVDLRDKSNPLIREFLVKKWGDVDDPKVETTHRCLENRWAPAWFRERGVDAVLVDDSTTGSAKGAHLSVALLNPDMIVGGKQAATQGVVYLPKLDADLTIEERNTMYFAFLNGVGVATASLSDDGTYLVSVTVEPEYRRKGVATALYRFIEQHIGHPLRPSPTYQSPDARDFWQSRATLKTSKQAAARNVVGAANQL